MFQNGKHYTQCDQNGRFFITILPTKVVQIFCDFWSNSKNNFLSKNFWWTLKILGYSIFRHLVTLIYTKLLNAQWLCVIKRNNFGPSSRLKFRLVADPMVDSLAMAKISFEIRSLSSAIDIVCVSWTFHKKGFCF